MSKNIYDSFADGEVKVFATKQGVAPRKFSGRFLRKMFPLLASSIMINSGCSLPQENVCSDGYIDNVELTEDQIVDMVLYPKNVWIKDLDYNHNPKSGDNYWNVVHQGLSIIRKLPSDSSLSDEEILRYKRTACEVLSNIKIANGEIESPDLSDPNTLRGFLFFEKVVEFKDDYVKVFSDKDGVYTEQNNLLGKNYKDCYMLICKARRSSGVNKFAKTLYNDANRFIINHRDSVKANEISRFILDDWLKSNNIKDDKLYKTASVNDEKFVNAVSFYYKPGKDFRLELKIDTSGNLGEGCFSPVGVNVIHELLHITQKKPSSNQILNEKDHLIEELGPTLNTLMLNDMIYKTIHKIPMDNVVNYGDLEIGNNKVSYGELAVWFRKMTEKYHRYSVDKILKQDEVFEKIEAMGNGEKVNLLSFNYAYNKANSR